MNIGISCGGTGGHIFPGLATAECLKARGHDVTIWLAGKDIESKAIEHWPGKVVTVPSQGFSRRFSLEHLRTLVTLFHAARRCCSIMNQDRPDVLLAMGSYASFGPVCAALKLGIPVVLHEANVIPGRAISLLSKWSRCTAISFEETRYHLKRQNLVYTGMPLRLELQKALAQHERKRMPNELFHLLVMGGSRGAHKLNEVVAHAACQVHEAGTLFHITHLTGAKDEEEVRHRYKANSIPHQTCAFHDKMEEIYTRTDMAICRSGASSCAEIMAFGIPALLVPYPFATKDHQTANARALERIGCADFIAESDISTHWLTDYLNECINSRQHLDHLRQASRKLQPGNGATNLANLIEKTAAESAPRNVVTHG